MKRTSYCGCEVAIISVLLSGGPAFPQEPPLAPSAVEIQMRAVSLRLDRYTVLEVARLRGKMVPTQRDRPVTFDDLGSFVTQISSAEIAIRMKTLSDLLNQRVFAYPDAPLKNIAVTAEHGRIKQTGTVHKGVDIPFELEGTLDVSPAGTMRLHVEKIASAHVPVTGLLHLLGEDLSKLIKLKQDRGVTVDGDNILLDPGRMLPPPRIEGKVTAVRVEDDRIVLTFQSGTARDLSPPYSSGGYIYHRGGVLRFGKLTMNDSDLEIVSESHHVPFDFSLPEYNRQLSAGYSKNTVSHGLIVFVGDLTSIPGHSAQ
jgi:hypothetical protein